MLKEGVTVKEVLENLKRREEQFREGVTFAGRGRMIRRMLPDVYDACMEKAENAYKGLTILPGSPELHFIGNPVKWHENIYGDEEYTYQLNRMDHWRTMAEAYSFTGDERFAKKIIEEFSEDGKIRFCFEVEESPYTLELFEDTVRILKSNRKLEENR